MKGEKYYEKVDAWALGIVILELWLNRRITEIANGGFPAFVNWLPSDVSDFSRFILRYPSVKIVESLLEIHEKFAFYKKFLDA